MPERGEIWVAHLGPKSGRAPGKTRPVLLVQAQALIDADHPSTLVIPLTTKLADDAEPLRIRVSALEKLHEDSDLLIDQLRALDNRLLVRGPLAKLPPDLMQQVGRAVCDVLDLHLE